jgi:cation diffusion facilitator CzcD-associated flavoprotein CzcO
VNRTPAAGEPASRGKTPTVAIIGAGFSGICLAIQLRQAGIETFTIFEKSDGVGGTWRDNSYPGAACDVPSFLYCFSFEVKTDWSRKYSPQPEILEYLEHCTDKYGVRRHIRFQTEVVSARFDEDEAMWRIRTARGDEHTANVLVSGVGQLNRPHYPDIPGLADFRGTCFHSARWNHSHDLCGENVAVIGNGASAIQIIPQIAPKTARVSVFQRSANWMLPRGDAAYSEKERRRLTRHPLLARLYRASIWARLEARWPAFSKDSWVGRRLESFARQEMTRHIADPHLREVLTPDYPVGCKRILISDDYYPALARDNVEVVTSPIRRVTPHGIVTEDGRERPVDTIILATGFRASDFLAPMDIHGTANATLNEVWKDGAEAYLGMTLSGFPNFFMLYGPNTNLGHNSIILMIECQVRYVMQCLRLLLERELESIDVRPETMRRYNREVQRSLKKSVWDTGCESWYKNEAGKITNNWPHSTVSYWWRTRGPDVSAFRLKARRSRPDRMTHAA